MLQIVAGLFIALAVPSVGVLMRVYARKHWNNSSGVKWRELSGVLLILVAATGYDLIFQPPFHPFAPSLPAMR